MTAICCARVEQLDPAELDGLAAILHDCVCAGASVGFVAPFDLAASRDWWRAQILPRLEGRNLVLWLARLDGRVVGTVQLDCAMPPNQSHRAEVRKLLVHPVARRRGIACALLQAVESEAAQRGLSLLTLDTRSGDAAETLYLRLGYRAAGCIPAYALDPDGQALSATTVMFKQLGISIALDKELQS